MDLSYLDSLIIKDEYTLGYEQSKIIAGLKKLPELFSEIKKIKKLTDDDSRTIGILFYINVLSELMNGKLYVDCETLAKRYRMKSPSPAMKHLKALTNVGFKFNPLRFAGSIKDVGSIKDMQKIHEILELIVSHNDTDILIALKVFADACGIYNRDYFAALDFRLLSTDTPKSYKPPEEEMSAGLKIKNTINEKRFDIVSDIDKTFIVAFDELMNELGYDIGATIGLNDWNVGFTYSKTGLKSKNKTAQIYISENGIKLRFYFKNIDNHHTYIENAPTHIKDAFTFESGNCTKCMSCKSNSTKIYTIDGRLYDKCSHKMVFFNNPTVEKLSDYIALFTQFYPIKKPKSVVQA